MTVPNRYLVTGANSGIGFALTARLLGEGHHVIGLDIDTGRVRNDLGQTFSDSFVSVECDVSDGLALEVSLSESIKCGDPLAGFVHVAGIPCALPIKSVSHDMAKKVFAINALAAIDLARITTRKGWCCDSGMSNVVVSSVYSLVGSSANSAYASSKAALNGFVRSMAIEQAARKIRYNSVAPGFIKTDMLEVLKRKFGDGYLDRIASLHPLGLGAVDDVVELVVFLLSARSRWITGAVIPVDGGFSAQ